MLYMRRKPAKRKGLSRRNQSEIGNAGARLAQINRSVNSYKMHTPRNESEAEEFQFEKTYEKFKNRSPESIKVGSDHDSAHEATLTEAELKQINENLRKEIERAVSTFEQYLRVAMLQTESDHLKEKLLDEKRKHQLATQFQDGGGVTLNIETSEEMMEEIPDPAIAYTIANLASGQNSSQMLSHTPSDQKILEM